MKMQNGHNKTCDQSHSSFNKKQINTTLKKDKPTALIDIPCVVECVNN